MGGLVVNMSVKYCCASWSSGSHRIVTSEQSKNDWINRPSFLSYRWTLSASSNHHEYSSNTTSFRNNNRLADNKSRWSRRLFQKWSAKRTKEPRGCMSELLSLKQLIVKNKRKRLTYFDPSRLFDHFYAVTSCAVFIPRRTIVDAIISLFHILNRKLAFNPKFSTKFIQSDASLIGIVVEFFALFIPNDFLRRRLAVDLNIDCLYVNRIFYCALRVTLTSKTIPTSHRRVMCLAV